MSTATVLDPAHDPDVPARALARALARRPRGLFVDIDGTLSAIADTPGEATVMPGCTAALDRLTAVLDLVCVLTGRPADDAWRMVGVDGATYVGNHGAETWHRGELLRPAGIERYQVRLTRARAILREVLANMPGLTFEDKGVGFAIHFRRNPAAEPVVLEAAWRAARRRGLQVVMRSAHVEVRAPLESDKGTALLELASRHGLAGLVVIGDDPVDAPAFEAARAHGLASGAEVLAVSVGDRLRGTADLSLAGPDETCAVLTTLAAELGA